MNYLTQLAIICPLVFIGGFIDSIAGGGGLISLPAYLIAGFPPHVAAGTNKMAAAIGLAAASRNYMKAGQIDIPLCLRIIAGALVGAVVGARIALSIDDRIFKLIIVLAIPVACVIMLLSRRSVAAMLDSSAEPERTSSWYIRAAVIGVGVGLYDGLIGPGTGTLMILLITGLLSVGLVRASASAKLCNCVSTSTSCLMFLLEGKVLFAVAIPAVIACILGNYFGSKYAIRGGAKYIKPMIVIVVAMLFIKLVYDLAASL